MHTKIISAVVFGLLLVLGVFETASAQIKAIGAGYFYNFSGAGGVDDGCHRPSTRPGLFLSGSYDFGVPGLSAQANMRFHQFESPADCILGMRGDGVHVFNDYYYPLYTSKFNATDVRIVFETPGPIVMSGSLGMGAAWRPSRGNLPYGLLDGALLLPVGSARIRFGMELQYIRVAFDRIEEEWQSSVRLSRTVLRSGVTRWVSGAALHLGLEYTFGKDEESASY
ncbi:MAG: hypothetical protein OEY63_04095 [Gemmatimonadota bacterium]|nr:hypothetical protein [Gemmatimonadota bacterium]